MEKKLVRDFTNAYLHQYKEQPYAISYVTYNTLQSVTDALMHYHCNYIKNNDNVLCSYKHAVQLNPQWHRPITHEVYEMIKNRDIFIKDI